MFRLKGVGRSAWEVARMSDRSSRIRTRGFLAYALIAFGAFVPVAPGLATTATPAPLQTLLDERAKSIDRSGLIVGEIDGPETTILTAGTSGTARPLDERTLFEIGSVTKTFTATILASMVLDGSVSLDDPVAKYLPAGVTVPERSGKKITLLNLATQHSGLPRLPTNLDLSRTNDPYATYTVADMYAFLSHYKLTRDPGARFEYSNYGVALLGQALANRAHLTYAELLRERVLVPLGMNDTTIVLSSEQRTRFAAGGTIDGDPATPWTIALAIAPAGGIHSTLADMLKYLRCNMGRGPLAKACLFAQQPRDTFPGNHIGLVWWTGDLRHIVHHGGDTAGYHASIAIAPDHTRGVVVLASGGMGVDDVAGHVLDATVPLDTLPPSIAVDSATLDSYVGVYRSKDGSDSFAITRSGDHLVAQYAKQDPFRVYASAPDTFYPRVVAATMHFVRTGNVVSALVFKQDGQTGVFTKPGMQPPAESSDDPPVVQLDAATLQSYVGNYASAYGIFYVTLEGSQLMVRLAGQSALPTFPSAVDHFYYKAVDAQIEFQRDGKGTVSGLTLHQNGAVVPATRQ
jgi:D-alanyl-D-alanine-carboxypeptidase/D-alanyl-D-alanine-endopeptidase